MSLTPPRFGPAEDPRTDYESRVFRTCFSETSSYVSPAFTRIMELEESQCRRRRQGP